MRVVAGRRRKRVAHSRARFHQKSVVGDQIIGIERIASVHEFIVALHVRPEAKGKDGSGGVPSDDVQRGAQDRRDVAHTRHAAKGGLRVGRSCDTRLGVEGEGSLRREANLEALPYEEGAKGHLHARGEHDHVEQHGGRHRDPEYRQSRAQRVAQQGRPGECKAHQRPKRESGGTRVSRCAATAPAPMPNASDSVTANTTVPGVTIENASGVR